MKQKLEELLTQVDELQGIELELAEELINWLRERLGKA